MFKQRIIKLTGTLQRDTAKAAIDNAPDNIEVVLREPVKARSLDQNSLYWSALNEIAEQAWVSGKQFTADTWHHYLKEKYLADEFEHPYLFEVVKNPESYKKYELDPKGNRVLIGSTTDLTKHGFSEYIDAIHAFGASLGVLFSERSR